MKVSELLIDVEGSHFTRCFDDLEDRRSVAQMRYPMPEVLFLVICSVLSGYEANRAIEEFGQLKLDWLRQYYPFIHGIPTHETIGNIIGIIDKQAFESSFLEWVQLAFGEQSRGLLHIDGKRIRSSANKELQDIKPRQGGQSAALIVNTYASASKLVVAQADVSDSGDEKEGARGLIAQLHLKNSLLTGDGNYCTKDMLKHIRNKEGHYLMTLKRNNPILFDLAEQYFGDVRIDKMSHYTEEQGHGRYERRTYHAIRINNPEHPKLNEYVDLRKIIRVRRQREVIRKNKQNLLIPYITTSPARINQLAS